MKLHVAEFNRELHVARSMEIQIPKLEKEKEELTQVLKSLRKEAKILSAELGSLLQPFDVTGVFRISSKCRKVEKPKRGRSNTR